MKKELKSTFSGFKGFFFVYSRQLRVAYTIISGLTLLGVIIRGRALKKARDEDKDFDTTWDSMSTRKT